ncbi:hypothetical protein ACUOFC_04170, partial [Escherichia sp. TWPC-MK]
APVIADNTVMIEAQLMRDFVADGGSLIGLVKKHCEIWAGD